MILLIFLCLKCIIKSIINCLVNYEMSPCNEGQFTQKYKLCQEGEKIKYFLYFCAFN